MASRTSSVIIALFCLALASRPFADTADSSATQGASSTAEQVFGELLKGVGAVLNEKLQDEFDRWLGNYEGKIEQVRFLEQTPDSITLEVSYRGIKRTDGVTIRGEVLRGGLPLPGFTSTLGQVQGKEGIARLTIDWQSEAFLGWEESATPTSERSDQLRLFLVREDRPDRPFGELIYDFPKSWGESSPMEGGEEGEAVELAEDEGSNEESASSGNTDTQPPFTAGQILVPVGGMQSVQGVKRSPRVPEGIVAMERYDFYDNAGKAEWRSNYGKLPFPGRPNDSHGFARLLPQARITDRGLGAGKVLESHPAWRHDGWIEGRYPMMLLADKPLVFRATASLLKGARHSNGALFKVYLKEKNYRIRRIYAAHVRRNDTRAINIDLSRWRNKRVQIILRVEADGNSAQDWAVWVSPRIEPQ